VNGGNNEFNQRSIDNTCLFTATRFFEGSHCLLSSTAFRRLFLFGLSSTVALAGRLLIFVFGSSRLLSSTAARLLSNSDRRMSITAALI